MFPELIIRNLGIINIHMAWRPMSLPESGSWKTWNSNVANEHLAKCVKACLRDIWFSRVKTAWKLNKVTTACQFFFNLRKLEHENMLQFAHGGVIETINCIVMFCRRRKSKTRWKHGGKHKKGNEKKR